MNSKKGNLIRIGIPLSAVMLGSLVGSLLFRGSLPQLFAITTICLCLVFLVISQGFGISSK